MRLGYWLGALAVLVPGLAHAEWRQASSAHFVVYANDSERDIRMFSQQLERYHAAMAMLTTAQVTAAPSPSNRVTVFVVDGQAQVRELAGSSNRYIAAFYVPRAGGSLAIVPRVTTGTTTLEFSMIALLHEYAHHFMISNSAFPMPRWYSEGGAEFFASASFPTDGGVSIGRPAQHRAAELLMPGFARDVTVTEMLDPPVTTGKRRTGYDAFYGKSWLLFHYLTFNEARQGQMSAYLQAMAHGKSSREAGQVVFGDFGVLEHELDVYLKTRRMKMLVLQAAALQTGPIEIRRLTPGDAAMMPVRVRSRRGVNGDEAKELVPQARAIAARFPGDPAVLSALAEVEHDAGNDKEAIAAADAAIALDPAGADAYVQKGLALFRIAEEAPDAEREAAFRRVRANFSTLNRRELDHPLPLVYYYRTFVAQGKEPPPLALEGLTRAVQLAPFDMGLRMTLGIAQIQHHYPAVARMSLAPVAYNPHGGELAAAAQRVLARLDSDPRWDGRDASAVAGATNFTDDGDAE